MPRGRSFRWAPHFTRDALENLVREGVSQQSPSKALKQRRTWEKVSSGGKGAAAMSCAALVVRRRSSSTNSPLQSKSPSAVRLERLPHGSCHVRQNLSTFLDHDSQRRCSNLGVENDSSLAQDLALLRIIRVSDQFWSFSLTRDSAARLTSLISDSGRSWSIA